MGANLDSLIPTLDTNGVSYETVPLDAESNQLLNNLGVRAARSTSDFAAEANKGVGQAGQMPLQTNQQLDQQLSGFGGGDPHMAHAIRSAFNARSSADVNRIKNQFGMQAEFEKSNAMKQAAQLAAARNKVNIQNFEGLSQAYEDSEKARAEVISSFMSLGGRAGGEAISRRMRQNEQGGSPQGMAGPQDGRMSNYMANGN